MVYDKFGPPDVLHLKVIEKPMLKDDETLVKVQTASINFGDEALVKGDPFLVRLALVIKGRVVITAA